MADPTHSSKPGDTDGIRISSYAFFDFCSNRQHVVRRLIERLGTSKANVDDNQDIQEAVVAAEEKAMLSNAPTGGDQWMASPTWIKTAERMMPKDISHIDTLPSTLLDLEWVHGYRGYDCRNNVRYLDDESSSFTYHAAALNIAFVKGKGSCEKKQIFFSEHTDDIISHATFGTLGGEGPCLIATGEIGKKPAINVYQWASGGSFMPLASIKGFHSAGVCQMAFAKDGKSVFTVGVDYSIAVYKTDVSNQIDIGKMICSSTGPKDRVLDCCALFTDSTTDSTRDPQGCFISCGEKHISYWTYKNKTLVQEETKLSSYKRDFIMCATAIAGEKQCVAGTSEGHLLYLQSGELFKEKSKEKLHKKAINALYSSADGKTLVTGGADGKVCCIRVTGHLASDVNLHLLNVFDVYGNAPIIERVSKKGEKSSYRRTIPLRSVCMSHDGTKLLVGNAACEIVEVTSSAGELLPAGEPDADALKVSETLWKAKHPSEGMQEKICEEVLVTGHYKEQLWGLAIRPVAAELSGAQEYCTVGDDGFLRVWDLATKAQKKFLDMGPGARCCDYSPDGQYLAVGFGGGRSTRKNKHNGAVRIYRADMDPMKQVCELKEAKQWISKLKFSPDGSILAVASRDNSVYTYSVAQQFKRKSKFSKHNAGILDLDFSKDGKYLQSTCSAYELLFSEHANGAQLTNGASLLAGEEWSTFTCSLGWPVMGIWSGTMDGSDVNSVDRSPDMSMLAVGDDSGKVNIYRYPATLPDKEGAPHHEYMGHSSHVTMVRWVTAPGSDVPSHLITTGGDDKCVFQWKAHADVHNQPGSKVPMTQKEDAVETSTLLDIAPSGGDEFTSVKPWLGAIHAPMAWSNPDPAKLPPFVAALGEMSALHQTLRQDGSSAEAEDGETNKPEETSVVAAGKSRRNLKETIDVYRKVVSSADEVFKRMSTSGLKNPSQPDGDELELEWVHGYRGFDCRNNVFYVDSPKGRCIVYHAASLGVKMTINTDGTHTQQYFRGHNDDITAMTVYSVPSPDDAPATHLVATGQQGKGKTYVWEVSNIKTLAILETGQKTVCQIAFVKQNGGRALVTIGEDQSVAISDWKSQTVLNKTKGDAADCYHIATAAASLSSTTHFLAVGNKFVTFWSLNGRTLTSKKVRSGSKGPGTAKFVSCAQAGNSFYIGCDDGNIYVFSPEENKRSYAISDSFSATTDSASSGGKGKGKKGAKNPSKLYVFALSATTSESYGDVLLSGCSDGSVTLFQLKGEVRTVLGSFNIVDMLSDGGIMAKQIYTLSFCEVSSAIIPVTTSPLECAPGVAILVGTRGCDLLEVTVPSTSGTGLDFSKASVARGVSMGGEEGDKEDTGDAKALDLVDEERDASQWAGVLLRGHCNNEVWGLACHPLLPEYVTVGDDMSMRCYDVTTRKMKYVVPLGAVARACSFNADGSLLAVGFGGRFGRGKEPKGGMVRLYHGNNNNHSMNQAMNFDVLCEVRDAKQWISDVKFSADSSTLCVAAHDCKIYIYDVTIEAGKSLLLPHVQSATLKLRTTFRKHSSVINHIDLSSEGRYMQSNCSAYELLFCDLTTGKQVTHSSQLKDVTWDSWTCKMGWPVQGIWQKGMDGSDINAACRSNSGHLLATADDSGKIHLFRYPVIEEGAGFLSYAGHSSHVTNVRWTAADEVLVSCGGADKCVMQWKHVMNEAAGEADVTPHDSEAGSADQNFETLGIEEISLDGPSGGDESGCVKPWLGAVRAPTSAPPINSAVPAVKMTLSWIHGYTAGNRCNVHMSSNLFYAADGQPVYPAASRGVRLDRNTNGGPFVQTFFEGHDDDILCLAVSADRRFVATGQTASHHSKGMGSICVWSATDCRLLARMDRCHQRGVYSVAFNPDGDELVSVGQDNKNTHKLWADLGGNWSRVQLTATATSDQSTIYFTHWLHKNHTLDCKLVSGGAKSINFWRLEGATLVKKQGRFGRKYKKAPLLCAANLQAKDEKSGKSSWATVAGTSTGDLYVFDEREVSSAVQKAHDGAVLCLAEGSGSEVCSFLVSGGKDKLVKVWNQALQPISNFDLGAYCIVDASVSSLDIRPDLDEEDKLSLTLLVGSYGGEIVELSSKPQAGSKSKVRSLDITSAHATTLISSHTMGELWGLAVHPSDPDMYCTVGDDSTLRIWSIKKQRQIATHRLGLGAARAVAWTQIQKSADEVEDVIAVGFGNGPNRNKGNSRKRRGRKAFSPKHAGTDTHTALCLFGITFGKNITVTELARWSGTDAEVSDLKFSPPNDLGRVKLGVACHDKHLYFFNMPDPDMDPDGMDWSLCLEEHADFNKHSSTVTHFDFNLDGSKFQSNCQAGELLFGEIDGGDGDGDIGKITAKHIPRASKMAEFNGVYDPKPSEDGEDNSSSSKWLTHTCTLGWPVQGIWSPGLDTSDINSCDRDMVEQLIATGDDFGHVKIFRYPAVAEGSKYLQLEGHSSHVTNVRWNSGENLLSTGGNDNCIFVWHCEKE